MVGLIITAHGRLAEALLDTATQIAGPLERVVTCNIAPGTSPAELRERLQHAITEVSQGDGVLILADLFGGTPCREALLVTAPAPDEVEVVAGVNLPMVLKAASLRREPTSLRELSEALVEYGQRHIQSASALLRAAQEKDRT